MTAQTRGVILFAHGSRDPLWSRPIEAIAARIGALQPGAAVQCAYLELMQPDLATAVQALVSQGVSQVRVVPMFLGVGKHARQDLPALVQALAHDYPHIRLELEPAIGEHPRVVDLMAHIALGE
jgi:sirohydrochlorin cobaltochelatase